MGEETVKNHYKGKERCKISLNDQLEDFYEGCKNNTISSECAYYFHTKRLNPREFKESQKQFKKFCSRMRNVGGVLVPRWLPPWLRIKQVNYKTQSQMRNVLIFADGTLVTENPFETMDDNEYLLYNCFRISLELTAQSALSFKPYQLDYVIHQLDPFLYTSLWRSSRPNGDVALPCLSISTNAIGLR